MPGDKGSSEDVNMQIDVGIIKVQMIEVKKQTDRIEHTLNNLSNVSAGEFDKFKDYVESSFVKKESLSGFKAIGIAVATAVAIGLVIAMLRVLGLKLS